MTVPIKRVIVPFCDRWADPGPDGAVGDALAEALWAEIEDVDPRQMPAWLVSHYVGAVDCGGHEQFFSDLHADVAARVPPTVDALHLLGLAHAADILSRAFARWRANSPDHIVFDYRGFDDEYVILGMADPADHPQSVLDAYLREHADLFIELAEPTAADQRLIEIGDPRMHRDGGRAAWLSLLDHECARVRLAAARNLMETDRALALRIARAIAGNRESNHLVQNAAFRLLRVADASLEGE